MERSHANPLRSSLTSSELPSIRSFGHSDYQRSFNGFRYEKFNVYDLLGLDPRPGTRWRADVDYLSRRGLKVPQDVSVIGFDNLQHAAFISPSLTTVHLPLYQVGVLACERLIERIRGRIEPIAETLPTHLVVRESTAMARSS